MKTRGAPTTKRSWQQVLDECVAEPQLELRKRRVAESHLPKIVNMVGTVSFLDPESGHKIPLEAVATHLGPCSQYVPHQFAANILKQDDVTGLLFSSGKLLLTASRTTTHALFSSHWFRLMLESVPCRTQPWQPLRPPSSLAGATIFGDLSVHNIVGHGRFRFNVNLERLRNLYPECVEWVPDNFPAARCKMWVNPEQTCKCGFAAGPSFFVGGGEQQVAPSVRKLMKRKCRCIIKCLVFSNGSIVMIGGKETRDVNYVFAYMNKLCGHLNHHRRRQAPMLLRLPAARLSAQHKESSKRCIEEEMALSLALEDTLDFKDRTRYKKLPFSPHEGSFPFLLYLAETGRLEAVRTLLSFEPELIGQCDCEGKSVLQRLQQMEKRNAQQEGVLSFLKGTTEATAATVAATVGATVEAAVVATAKAVANAPPSAGAEDLF